MAEKSLSLRVYEKVKEDIISLKYQPGSILKERELAEGMGVSRTPVREALQRLAQEFWITNGEGKKIQVSYITLKDAREIEQVRNIIEFAAIEHIISNGNPRLLAGQLDAIINEMKKTSDDYEFMRLDLAFHTVIVSSMDNGRLIRFWNSIRDEIIRMGLLAMRNRLFYDQVVPEHEMFIDALWKKDLELVKKAMSQHLKHCYESIFSALALYEKTMEAPKAE